MTSALIVVDVQNDFCEGGSLAVSGGADVAASIGETLQAWRDATADERAYDFVVATRDHHVDPGVHFSPMPDYVDSWPVHCVVGSPGEEFHPALEPRPFDEVFLKGEYEAAYSGFEGATRDGALLVDWLRARDVTHVDVCGIATDFCVKATALDAARAGFETEVLLDLTAAVDPGNVSAVVDELAAAGVTVTS